jgi:predicted nucleic acid-binding Zn ribbon protein
MNSPQRREPQSLAQALSELIALRGLARIRGRSQLAEVWAQVAGERIAACTKPIEVRRGTLHIAVSNAALLGELVSFHKPTLQQALQKHHADLRIKDIKFKLRTESAKD